MFDYINFKKVWPYVINKNSGQYYDVCILRPSKWSNPYSHLDKTLAKYKVETRNESLVKYEEYIRNDVEMIKTIKKELKNKVLSCLCSPKLCHGHILAWIANFED